jgi:hypothetical protein
VAGDAPEQAQRMEKNGVARRAIRLPVIRASYGRPGGLLP